MNFELDYIEKLVKLVSESDLTELTLEEGEEAIVVRKERRRTKRQTYHITYGRHFLSCFITRCKTVC